MCQKVSKVNVQSFYSTNSTLLFLEPRDKVLKIKTRQRLIGAAGKVYLEPGDTVHEVDPEEDGMVNVRTSDGIEGSIPVTAIGRETLLQRIIF